MISLMMSMALSVLIGTAGLQWLAITEYQYYDTKRSHHEIEKIFATFRYFQSEIKKSNYLASCFNKDLTCNCRVELNNAFLNPNMMPYPRFEQTKTVKKSDKVERDRDVGIDGGIEKIERVGTAKKNHSIVPPNFAVFGFTANYENCTKLPDFIYKNIKPETEVLVIYNTVSTPSFKLTKPVFKISELQVPSRSGIWENVTLLIKDAISCDFFVKDTSGLLKLERIALRNVSATLSNEPELSKEYGIGSKVTPLQTALYYIGEKKGESSLYRRDLQREVCDEILAGISKIEYQYGIYDSKNSCISYWKAEQVENLKVWKEVRSLRIRITAEEEKPSIFQRVWGKRKNASVWMLEVALPNWNTAEVGSYE